MKLVQSLVVAILAFALSASAFSPAAPLHAITSTFTRLNMADTATPSTAEQTYVKCGRCQTAYVVSLDDLGANGKGR